MLFLMRAHRKFISAITSINFIPPLLVRIYLAPIFIYAGLNKASSFDATVAWFGNAEWGLGLPAPALLAILAIGAEVVGGFALLAGVATRLATIPLIVTMLVAIFTVHWQNGWHALPEQELMVPWEWRSDLIASAVERKQAARELLQANGNYGWLTEAGNITVLKNGIEFSATYLVMLLSLLAMGAGRWVSVDYWANKKFNVYAAQEKTA